MKELRVMQSFPAIRPTTNPYIKMLDASLAKTLGVGHVRFSWRRALIGNYDVLHFHWPETLFNASTIVNRLIKRVLFAALLARLRVTRTPIVRTVHNIELPHDVTAYQRWLLRQVERITTLRIRIGETTVLPPDQPSVLILHGDYRGWFSEMPRHEPIQGRLGFVGLVRRYKGVELLISAFRELAASRSDLTLGVSGNPTSSALAQEIRSLAGDERRIELDLRFLDDPDFVTAMTSAQLVVLPYRFMHNSGGVLAALSLDRPVLVPRNEANEALAREVGTGWVLMYNGELDAPALAAASDAVTFAPPSKPDLSRRAWDDVGIRHREAYVLAVARRTGRTPDRRAARS